MSSGLPTASRYRMYDEVAAGGMAVVHLGLQAGDSGFSRVVAIKRLIPDLAREADFVNMFIDEARLAARIRHPNVVHILDVVHDDKQLLLVMEYIPGESLGGLLAAAIRGSHDVPIEVASAIMVGALHGLHAAHEACDERQAPLHIVHRDVSPQNILVGEDGIPRVIDFGVAKAVGRLTTTRDGRVKGKAGYMAPEQLRGQKIDRRVDVYAAGVVLWELLVKRRLFVGDSPAATMMLVLERGVEPPSAHGAAAPLALDEVVLKATQKNPDARYQTAEEMAVALEAAVRPANAAAVAAWARAVGAAVFAKRRAMVDRVERGEGTPAATVSSPAPLPEGERTHAATVASAPVERQRSRWPLAVALVPIVGIAGWYFVSHRSGSPSPIALGTTAAPPSSVIASASAPVEAPPPATTSVAVATQPSQAPSVAPTVHRPVTTARPTATSKVDCNPPFVIDSKGIRVPKKECL